MEEVRELAVVGYVRLLLSSLSLPFPKANSPDLPADPLLSLPLSLLLLLHFLSPPLHNNLHSPAPLSRKKPNLNARFKLPSPLRVSKG